jgi:hypothetical protein
MTYNPDAPSDAWVVSAKDGSEAGVVWSPDSRDVHEAVTRHFAELTAGGYYMRRLRAREITARYPRRLTWLAGRIVSEAARGGPDNPYLDGLCDAFSAITGRSSIAVAAAATQVAARYKNTRERGAALLAEFGMETGA